MSRLIFIPLVLLPLGLLIYSLSTSNSQLFLLTLLTALALAAILLFLFRHEPLHHPARLIPSVIFFLVALVLLLYAGSLLPLALWLLFVGLSLAAYITLRLLGKTSPNPAAATRFCPTCGYDLRASFERCPECGSDLPPDLVRRRALPPDLIRKQIFTAQTRPPRRPPLTPEPRPSISLPQSPPLGSSPETPPHRTNPPQQT